MSFSSFVFNFQFSTFEARPSCILPGLSCRFRSAECHLRKEYIWVAGIWVILGLFRVVHAAHQSVRLQPEHALVRVRQLHGQPASRDSQRHFGSGGQSGRVHHPVSFFVGPGKHAEFACRCLSQFRMERRVAPHIRHLFHPDIHRRVCGRRGGVRGHLGVSHASSESIGRRGGSDGRQESRYSSPQVLCVVHPFRWPRSLL